MTHQNVSAKQHPIISVQRHKHLLVYKKIVISHKFESWTVAIGFEISMNSKIFEKKPLYVKIIEYAFRSQKWDTQMASDSA